MNLINVGVRALSFAGMLGLAAIVQPLASAAEGVSAAAQAGLDAGAFETLRQRVEPRGTAANGRNGLVSAAVTGASAPPTVEQAQQEFAEALATFFAEELFSKPSADESVREITSRIKDRMFDLSKLTIGISYRRLHQITEAAGRRYHNPSELRSYFLGADGSGGILAGLKATLALPGLRWGAFRQPEGVVYKFLQAEGDKLPRTSLEPIPANTGADQLKPHARRLKAYLENLEYTAENGAKKRFKIGAVNVMPDPRNAGKNSFQVELLERDDFQVLMLLGGLRYALGRETGGLFESFARKNIKFMGVQVYWLSEPPPAPDFARQLRPFLEKRGVEVRDVTLIADTPTGTASGAPKNANVARVEIAKPNGPSNVFASISEALLDAQSELPWMTRQRRRAGVERFPVVSTWEIVTIAPDGEQIAYRNKNPYTGLPVSAAKKESILASLSGLTIVAYDNSRMVHGLEVQRLSRVKAEDVPALETGGWILRQRLGRGKKASARDYYLSAPAAWK